MAFAEDPIDRRTVIKKGGDFSSMDQKLCGCRQ